MGIYLDSSGQAYQSLLTCTWQLTRLWSIRYPFDHYDRMWTPDNRLPSKSSLLSRNTSSNISSSQDDGFRVPIRVMRTFVTPSNGSNINIPWDMTPDPTIQQHIVLHLAEIQLLRSNESRIFDIFLNEKLWYGAFSPRYLQTDHIFTTEPINQRSNMIRISKAANSTLPPILNAIEVYQVKSFSELATDNGDGRSSFIFSWLINFLCACSVKCLSYHIDCKIIKSMLNFCSRKYVGHF